MSCHSYEVACIILGDRHESLGWGTTIIKFDDLDGPPCLCTLNATEVPDAVDIRSMAYLGAAVALAHKGHYGDGSYNILPYDLPVGLKTAIDGLFASVGVEVQA